MGAFLKEKLSGFQPQMVSYEYGTVVSCADDIVRVSGLSRAKYGELLEFENDNYGIALDMSLDGVSAALLSRGGFVRPGSVARGHRPRGPTCASAGNCWGGSSIPSAGRWTAWSWRRAITGRWSRRRRPLWTARRWIRRWRPASWLWTA